jgi:hypothetical protein
MKFYETFSKTLSNDREVVLSCSCNICKTEVVEFTFEVKNHNALNFTESEIEECNKLAHEWANETALSL